MKFNIREIIWIGLFAALTAISAFIQVPIPYVPITMQFILVAYTGIILGGRLGAITQCVYVGLGLMGLPILAKGGGLWYLFEPSFGFLIGFIFAAGCIGYLNKCIKKRNVVAMFLVTLSGIVVTYFFGGMYFYLLQNIYLGVDMSIVRAIQYVIIPFIPGDLIKCMIVSVTAIPIMNILKKMKIMQN